MGYFLSQTPKISAPSAIYTWCHLGILSSSRQVPCLDCLSFLLTSKMSHYLFSTLRYLQNLNRKSKARKVLLSRHCCFSTFLLFFFCRQQGAEKHHLLDSKTRRGEISSTFLQRINKRDNDVKWVFNFPLLPLSSHILYYSSFVREEIFFFFPGYLIYFVLLYFLTTSFYQQLTL